jgi:Spy/CpxP family protein refolding chaperone
MNRYWTACILFIASVAGAQILPRGLGSRWWKSPPMVEKLSLTADQQKKMDDIFQQSRLKLIDLTASLDKQEAIMEPLVSAERPDAEKIRAQIDQIAQARAELEKANSKMLLELRLVLTPDQWKSLQTVGSGLGPRPRRIADGPDRPGPPVKKQP